MSIDRPALGQARRAAIVDFVGFFLSPILLGLSGAFLLGPDANWDLANYHYYNAWAFLNGRIDYDVAPAGIQTFFNPILDLPFYWANAHLPPRLTAFCLASVQGICISAVYAMARRLLFPRPLGRDALAAMAVAFVAIVCPASLFEIATTFYDYVGAVALTVGCALLMPGAAASPRAPPVSLSRVILSGLILGGAAAAKETNIPLMAGIGFAIPLLGGTGREAASRFVVFGAGALAGALALGGWWALFLWRDFHNPIFPMYNAIFHSPLAPLDITGGTRWGAHGWFEWLFFPFVLLRHPLRGGEFAFRDPRLAALLLAVPIGLFLLAVTRRRRAEADSLARIRFLQFLLAGLFLAYLFWLLAFAYERYALALEVMAPLVCALVAAELPWQRWRVPIGGAVLAVLLTGFTVITWQRGQWPALHGRIVDVTLPALGVGSGDLVLLHNRPQAFIAPWFPAGARFVQFSDKIAPGTALSKLAPKIACLIAAQKGRIFIVVDPGALNGDWKSPPTLVGHGLRMATADCRPIGSTICPPGSLYLCPLSREAPPSGAPC